MDDLFPLLMFLIFILAPLIEGLRKKGKPPQQPPARRPPMQRPPTQRPLPGPAPARRSQTEEVSSKSADAASTMIPDELWQILTGERRPPVTTKPPEPASTKQPWDVVYIPPDEEEDEEALVAEDVDVEIRRTQTTSTAQPARWTRSTPVSLEEEPVVVSLEVEPKRGEARHVSFHEKLTATELATPQRPARKTALGDLSSRSELQRAFILQEVLGKPRGLE